MTTPTEQAQWHFTTAPSVRLQYAADGKILVWRSADDNALVAAATAAAWSCAVAAISTAAVDVVPTRLERARNAMLASAASVDARCAFINNTILLFHDFMYAHARTHTYKLIIL